jgi:predicted secreted Zn-dependent protease
MTTWGPRRLLLVGGLFVLLSIGERVPDTSPPLAASATARDNSIRPAMVVAEEESAAGGPVEADGQDGVQAKALAPEPLPRANLNVTSEIVYYDIRGASADELAAQINALGPVDGERRFAANASWLISWSYSYELRDGLCAIALSKVEVKLTYTYPRWNPPQGVDPALIARWERFVAAVELHEQGHGDLAMEAAGAVLRAIEDSPPRRFCGALGEAINAQSAEILEGYNRRQIRYDADTRHGEMQGASF